MLSSVYGWAGVALGILLILGALWAFFRWVLKRGEDRQAYLDKIEQMKRERAELDAKLRAAISALEAMREAKRDPISRLPGDLGVQSRQKPVSGTLGQPPPSPRNPGLTSRRWTASQRGRP